MPHKKTDDDSGPKVNDLGIDPHLQIKIAPILSSIRDKCLRMGQHGFDLLRRKVNARDARIETKMDPDKFRMSLMDLGIMLSGNDVKHLALAFKDGQGYLRVNMLCDHICGFLSPERQALVDAIFELLDVDRSGQLEIADLKEVANFSQHPAVLSGKMSADAAMRQYLDIFESDTPDGVITREEFHAYYAGVSENCPTLEYFEDVVRSAWKFLDLSRLKVKKAARRSERSTPADEGEVPKGNTTIPPRTAAADAAAGFTSTRGTSPTRMAKRVVGYTGHVPMARERFGETFHRIDAATPELTVTKEPYYGPSYVDEKNSFKRQGNKSNAHSFKFA